MSIGRNIAKYRKASGLTQEEFGIMLGVTNQAVSKWESEVSSPDIMLLPEIASVLGITLENIYGIEKESEKNPVAADNFPAFCYKKLIELFYYNTKMRFTHIGSSDEEQLDYQIQKIMEGCRIGCISNTQGAMITTADFAFVDLDYKSNGNGDLVRMAQKAESVLMNLSDRNVRKVLLFQYTAAMDKSKESNSEFTLEDVMYTCNLTEEEASAALRCLEEININETYNDHKTKNMFLDTRVQCMHWQYISFQNC